VRYSLINAPASSTLGLLELQLLGLHLVSVTAWWYYLSHLPKSFWSHTTQTNSPGLRCFYLLVGHQFSSLTYLNYSFYPFCRVYFISQFYLVSPLPFPATPGLVAPTYARARHLSRHFLNEHRQIEVGRELNTVSIPGS